VIDSAWQSYRNDDDEYIIRFQACADYNSTTNNGTWVDLGFEIQGKPTVEGTWVEAVCRTFALRKVNAIRVLWDYMAGNKTSETYLAAIHSLEINGNLLKRTLVQLSDQDGDAGNPNMLIAKGSFEKMRGGILATDGVGGCQRVKTVPIGAASGASAVSMGRTLLTVALRQINMRRYRYEGEMPGTPELGITIAADEDGDGSPDYTGVLREYSMAIGAGGHTITTGVVLDTAADVIE
jgi:hypothetical protein